MTDAEEIETAKEKAALFRTKAREQGLLIDQPPEGEKRFVFRLPHGDITVSGNVAMLIQLMQVAKACWGEDGDFDELQCATATHEALSPATGTDMVEWSLKEDDSEEVQFIDWLRGQVTQPQAVELSALFR